MKRMVLAKRNSKSSDSSQKKGNRRSFALCVRNKGYSASLERRKLYPIVEDESAAKHHLVRIIDESGEEYLYPEGYFVFVPLPASVELALSKAS
jgi:hypothetical protein